MYPIRPHSCGVFARSTALGLWVVVTILASTVVSTNSAVWWVSPSGRPSLPCGSTEVQACGTVQLALDSIATNRTATGVNVVYLMRGVYPCENGGAGVLINQTGIVITGESDSTAVTFDCGDIGGRVFHFVNVSAVVR